MMFRSKDKYEKLYFRNAAKKRTYQDLYENLLNVKFILSEDNLASTDDVPGSAPLAAKDIVAVI